jgi:Ca-activated chloride channel family protein
VTFQSPYVLIALVAVPLLVFLAVVRERRRRASGERFGNPDLLPNVVEPPTSWRRHLPIAVLLVALAAMIVGVARPHATVSVPREEATVMLAIDTSRSMGARDVNPSRLGAAQNAAYSFLAKLPAKYRFGIVSFASRAVVGLPPTTDRALARQALGTLRPGEGTALGDAVVLSVKTGRSQRTSDGVVPPLAVLMISDGAQESGRTSPAAAAQVARAAHAPVYTVLVGTDQGTVRAPVPGAGGLQAIISVPPKPAILQTLAHQTGGQYFTATTDSRLRDVYERLGSRLGNRKESRELTDAFAGGSGLLMLVGAGLSLFWFRRVLP